MISYEHHYYDGAWQTPAGPATIDVISSATEDSGRPGAARHGRRRRSRGEGGRARGFERWSRVPVEERAQWLEKLAAAMKPRVPQVAEAIAHEVGHGASGTRRRCRRSSRSR